MDDLANVAAVRGGFLTRGELLDLGHSDTDIRAAVAEHVIVRPRRGFYVPAACWVGLLPEDKHRILVKIAARRFGDTVVVTHKSASIMWGCAAYGHDLKVVDVTRVDGGAGRLEAGVRHRRGRLDPEHDATRVDGVLVANEDLAHWHTAIDVSVEGGMVTFDSALRKRPDLAETLRRTAPNFERWPGSRRARLSFRLADPRSESVGETRGRHLFWRHAVPCPELQREVRSDGGELIGRTDYAWLDGHHLGEFDGMVKYQSNRNANVDPSVAVVREKIREDRLRATGAGMSRLTWNDLSPGNQHATAQKVVREIEESRRLRLRNRTVIMLGRQRSVT